MPRLLAMAVAVYVILMPVALGQGVCAPIAEMRGILAGQHAESPIGAGMDNRGIVIEVYTARDGSTWTILVVRPDGVACIAGAGEKWQAVLPGSPS